jgi:histone H3/H4
MTEDIKPTLPSFVVETRMKEYIIGNNLHSTSDVVDELNRQVAKLLDEAVRRCKANGRSTVQPKDL